MRIRKRPSVTVGLGQAFKRYRVEALVGVAALLCAFLLGACQPVPRALADAVFWTEAPDEQVTLLAGEQEGDGASNAEPDGGEAVDQSLQEEESIEPAGDFPGVTVTGAADGVTPVSEGPQEVDAPDPDTVTDLPAAAASFEADLDVEAALDEPAVDDATAQDVVDVLDEEVLPTVALHADQNGWAVVHIEGLDGWRSRTGAAVSLKLEMAEGVGVDEAALVAAVPNARCTVEYTYELGTHPVVWVDEPVDADYVFSGALLTSVETVSLVLGEGDAICVAFPDEEVSTSLLAGAAAGERKWMDLGERVYYDSYLTFRFTVDGHSAQCASPAYRQPDSNWYTVVDPWSVASRTGVVGDRWSEVRFAMYYGPDGPGYSFGKQHIWPSVNWNGEPASDEDIYVMQHMLIADTAFSDGSSALYGCSGSFVEWTRWNVTGFDAYGNVINHEAAGRKLAEGGAYGGGWIAAPPDDFDVFMLYTGDATQYIIGMNYELTGSVELQKRSSDGSGGEAASLEGAVYELRAQDQSVVATLVTDAGGYAFADGIAAGEYTLVETHAPEGFEINATAVGVTVSAGTAAHVDVVDRPLFGAIVISKADSQQGSAQGDATLEGARFDVVNATGATVFVSGAPYADGEVVLTITTDVEGRASTGRVLPFGTWRVVESQAPQGYRLADGWSQTVTTDGSSAVYTVAVAEEVLRGSISLDKADAQLGGGRAQGAATLEGARFSVTNASVAAVVYDGSPIGPGQVVAYMTTDEQGHAELTGLPWGTYLVQEVEAPQGYLLPEGWSRQVVVHTDQTVSLVDGDQPIDQVVRGGVALSKLDAQTYEGWAQGDATLAGALFSITNESPNAVVVGSKTVAPGEVAATITTDDAGFAQTGPVLPYGSYRIEETVAPDGYMLPEGWSAQFEIVEEGQTVWLEADDAPADEVVRGGVSLDKVDAQTLAAVPQGDASLAGARFDVVNASEHAVCVDGRVVEAGEVALTLTTDASGHAESAADALPFGTYEIVEVTPPPGYLLPENASQIVQIRGHGTVVACEAAFSDEVKRGGLDVQKIDAETGEARPIGEGSLEGTLFDVLNNSAEAVVVNGETFMPGDLIMTISTDESGVASTEAVLPYGTYAVVESKAPLGYLPGDGRVVSVEVRAHGQTAHASSFGNPFANEIARGDFRFNKVREDSMERMGGVAFLVTSTSTGEAHVVLADRNGSVDTSAAWNPHRVSTNANDRALLPNGTVDEALLDENAGVWFSGGADLQTEPRDDRGALPYGTYRVTELPCAANKGMQLVFFDVAVMRDGVVIDMGTVDDRPAPSIATELTGEDGSHVVSATDSVDLVDAVGYMNLPLGDYSLNMQLVDAETGEALLDGDGSAVVGRTDFRAIATSGIVRVHARVDASSLAGRSIVAFETLVSGEAIVAQHSDLADAAQTVHVVPEPVIKTTLTESQSGEHDSAASNVTLVDEVEYSGLVPGESYTVYGVLYDKGTGLPVGIEGSTAVQAFTPEKESGSVAVKFEFDASGLAGSSVVAFEELSLGKKVVAQHKDIGDDAQTVRFPSLSTTLTDDASRKRAFPKRALTLVDVVAYENLIPGMQYTVEGSLFDKTSGTAVVSDGAPVVAKATFIPSKTQGRVEVEFTVDARDYAGHEIVAFETLMRDDRVVATHIDPDSPAQTVGIEDVPSISTRMTTPDGSHSASSAQTVELTDVVSYSGLEPGASYILKGTLMVHQTGSALEAPDGRPVVATGTFVAQESTGSTSLTFRIDPASLQVGGLTLVAFEELARQDDPDTVVASHKDIDDGYQSVAFDRAQIMTTLVGDGSSHSVEAAKTTRLVDTVEYYGLVPGTEYVAVGTLMDASTGKPVELHGEQLKGETSFVAQASSGSVDVVFEFDATSLAGRVVVAFEEIFGPEGNVVAEHKNISDAKQSVYLHEPGSPGEFPSRPDSGPVPETPVRSIARQLVQTGDMIEANKPFAVVLAVTATALLALGTVLMLRYRRRAQ